MEGEVQDTNRVVEDLKIGAKNMSGWLKLVGIVNIVLGAMSALSIVGIIFAWVPIWMGILLFQAGGKADEAQLQNRPEQLKIMLDKLRVYFLIQGIMIIVAIGFSIIGMLVFGLSIGSLMDQFN